MAKKEERALVVKSAVRELVGDFRVSEDFWGALNKSVEELVKRAVERAKANGRKTVRGADLWMKVIGITGTLASGKTTVKDFFLSRFSSYFLLFLI